MQKLSDKDIQDNLKKAIGWKLNAGGQIERQFEFKDFKESIFFVNSVAHLSEKFNHHPDILILWNKVRLAVNTHDAGGITTKDFSLAKAVNDLFDL